jgi:hypothetical protein
VAKRQTHLQGEIDGMLIGKKMNMAGTEARCIFNTGMLSWSSLGQEEDRNEERRPLAGDMLDQEEDMN